MTARLVRTLDFWILFSARIARYPAAWIVLHRLLSAPLLLGMPRCTVSVAGVVVDCRVRSVQLGWLLGEVRPPGGAAGDLEVVQVQPWTARWWRRRGWWTVPAFVRYRAPVDAVPPARVSKGLRANLTRVRRSGLEVRRGADCEWHTARAMVESWARARFRSDAWLPPEHAWRRMRRHGHLLVVGDGSRDVASAIVVTGDGGREVWLASVGVADGDTDLLRAGAVTAVYAAVADDARRRGASVVDVGRCSARTDDPIAAYKRRWGLRPTADPLSPVYAVRARTPAGERFLAAQPLWVLGPRGTLRRADAPNGAGGSAAGARESSSPPCPSRGRRPSR